MKTTVHFLDRRSFVPQYDLEFDILYAYKVATQVVTTTKKHTKIELSSIYRHLKATTVCFVASIDTANNKLN